MPKPWFPRKAIGWMSGLAVLDENGETIIRVVRIWTPEKKYLGRMKYVRGVDRQGNKWTGRTPGGDGAPCYLRKVKRWSGRKEKRKGIEPPKETNPGSGFEVLTEPEEETMLPGGFDPEPEPKTETPGADAPDWVEKFLKGEKP